MSKLSFLEISHLVAAFWDLDVKYIVPSKNKFSETFKNCCIRLLVAFLITDLIHFAIFQNSQHSF